MFVLGTFLRGLVVAKLLYVHVCMSDRAPVVKVALTDHAAFSIGSATLQKLFFGRIDMESYLAGCFDWRRGAAA